MAGFEGQSCSQATPSRGRACLPFLVQSSHGIQPQHHKKVVESLTKHSLSSFSQVQKRQLSATAASVPSSSSYSPTANHTIALKTVNKESVELFEHKITAPQLRVTAVWAFFNICVANSIVVVCINCLQCISHSKSIKHLGTTCWNKHMTLHHKT